MEVLCVLCGKGFDLSRNRQKNLEPQRAQRNPQRTQRNLPLQTGCCPSSHLSAVRRSETMIPQQQGGSALKYRQHGYQDRGEETRKKESTERPVKKDTFGPRPIQMP